MSGKNTIVKSVATKSIFEAIRSLVDITITWNQGDSLYFDTSAKLIKRLAAEANAATYLGLARQSIYLGKPVSPYTTDVDASTGIPDMAGPVYGVTAKMILQTGDSLAKGDQVYADPVATGNRGVASTGTKPIGIYQGAAVSGVAAGTEVEILIGARYSNDTLKF